MAKNFITVSLILDALKNERTNSASSPRMESVPAFREWKVGFIVAHKNDRATTYKIAKISDGETTGYGSTVDLVGVDDDAEKRTLRGATMQASYVFISRGDVAMNPEEVKKTIKPMTLNVGMIKTFAPRTKGRPGTRIVVVDGPSYACVEDHDTILAMVERATKGGGAPAA